MTRKICDSFLKSRSGQFFSLMTVFMIMPVLALSLSFTESLSGYGEETGSLVRLKSSYYYYSSLNRDLLRAGEIIGRRSTVSALNRVVDRGVGLNGSKSALAELFENGTVNGSEVASMKDSTIYDWLNGTEVISRDRGYLLDLDLKNFTGGNVYMKSPWEVAFRLNYSLGLSDKTGLFTLEKNLSKVAEVSIENLEDPLVTLRTGGRLVYPVKKAPFDYFTKKLTTGRGNNSWSAGDCVVMPPVETKIGAVNDKSDKILVINDTVSDDSLMNMFAGVVVKRDADMSGITVPYVVDTDDGFYDIRNNTRIVVDGNDSEVWEIENLYLMWKNRYYTGGDGPSFLGRLENNISSTGSSKGLNVLLKKENLEDAGLAVREKSNLAHIYFSDKTTVSYKVKGMPASFRIDKNHTDTFGLNNTLSFG